MSNYLLEEIQKKNTVLSRTLLIQDSESLECEPICLTWIKPGSTLEQKSVCRHCGSACMKITSTIRSMIVSEVQVKKKGDKRTLFKKKLGVWSV